MIGVKIMNYAPSVILLQARYNAPAVAVSKIVATNVPSILADVP